MDDGPIRLGAGYAWRSFRELDMRLLVCGPGSLSFALTDRFFDNERNKEIITMVICTVQSLDRGLCARRGT
jgi:hypothetical protein